MLKLPVLLVICGSILYKLINVNVNVEVIVKKLLLVVIGVFVLSMSFMFSGCAKHPSGPLGYLSYKVHNWKQIKRLNPSMVVKYNKVCWGEVFGHENYVSSHYSSSQYYNIIKNCKIVAPPRTAVPIKR